MLPFYPLSFNDMFEKRDIFAKIRRFFCHFSRKTNESRETTNNLLIFSGLYGYPSDL